VDFDQMMDQKVATSDRKIAEESALTWLKVCIIYTYPNIIGPVREYAAVDMQKKQFSSGRGVFSPSLGIRKHKSYKNEYYTIL